LRLACAEPGDQLAIFGEALRELTERASYLYEEGGRYWFSTQPTLNKEAETRSKAYPNHEVDAAIADVLREDARSKGGFHGVFAAPDDPTGIDEAKVLSLVILAPSTPHAGKGIQKSAATEAVTETLMRCRATQRRLRNTLIFVAPDEALLATAREAMRRAKAWDEISGDKRLRNQLPSGQIRDAEEKAKTSREGAAKAVRQAWSHLLYPVKTEATAAGVPFDLEQSSITSKDRLAIPVGAYDKIGPRGDGTVREKLGPDALSLHLKPLWPQDRPYIPINEIVEWFASYVYLPKLRDRVVLDTAIREAVAKLDPAFGYADSFDQASGAYPGLIWAKAPPELMPTTAVLVRRDVVLEHLQSTGPTEAGITSGGSGMPGSPPTVIGGPAEPAGPAQPHRFYGSVEIDMDRPVKSFDAILSAVVMELQRTQGAKVKLTLEIEAEAPGGFPEGEVSVVRDNARQLKFKGESTGFED
jgi:hypothetical protein